MKSFHSFSLTYSEIPGFANSTFSCVNRADSVNVFADKSKNYRRFCNRFIFYLTSKNNLPVGHQMASLVGIFVKLDAMVMLPSLNLNTHICRKNLFKF